MKRLLNFLIQNRAFFTFLALELICFWLIIQNNSYHGAKFFNSSSSVAANMLSVSQNVNTYLNLKVVNQELAEENTRLRQLLEQKDALSATDSALAKRFEFESGGVVDNSVSLFRNFITVNRGASHGIKPGMAVISSNKAIGKVKATSKNFSVIISILNLDENISATISRTGNFGTLKWDGVDPRFAYLQFIPRHVSPASGDSVITSGLNSVFPEGILIGTIVNTDLKPNEDFWDLKVELAQDFTKLQHVDIIKSVVKPEIDSIQQVVTNPM
jgi:rod shape-determining protein MreC